MRRRILGRTRPGTTQEIRVKRGKGLSGGKRVEGANPPPPNTNLDGALGYCLAFAVFSLPLS